jgi:hypothetical protein
MDNLIPMGSAGLNNYPLSGLQAVEKVNSKTD